VRAGHAASKPWCVAAAPPPAIVIRFWAHKSVNSFLMQRDLDPASNDNSPAFITEKDA
jgi:hypothetical protein